MNATRGWFQAVLQWLRDSGRCPWRPAVVLLFAATIRAQSVRVVFADGREVDQIGVGTKTVAGLEITSAKVANGRLRVRLRNPGKTEWTAIRPQDGARVWLRDVFVGVPKGYALEWAAERQALDLGFDFGSERVWHVLGAQHRRSVFPRIPESKTTHVLTGGESVWWDFVAPSKFVPDPTVVKRCRSLLYLDDRYAADLWPERARLAELWTLSADSLSFASTNRDMGWLTRWWAKAKSQGRVPDPIGPFDWGAVLWADGHCAHHYDLMRWAVERYLTAGDDGALALAYLWARHWASQSFIWSDVPEFEVQHAIRYEKGYYQSSATAPELGRPGNGADSPPRNSHQWDTGALMVAHLTGDRDLLEVVRLRGEYALRAATKWTPNGPRAGAWGIENLTAHYAMTGDARFRDRIQTRIGEALRAAYPLGAGSPAWPDESARNALGTVQWSPWQASATVATIRGACEVAGIALSPADDAKLWTIAEETCERGTRLVTNGRYLQGAMVLDRGLWQGAPLDDIWQGPTLTANYLPTLHRLATRDPGRWGARWQAACRTAGDLAFTGFGGRVPPIPSERQADCSGHGLAASKIFGDQSWGNRPRWMVPPAGVGAAR